MRVLETMMLIPFVKEFLLSERGELVAKGEMRAISTLGNPIPARSAA